MWRVLLTVALRNLTGFWITASQRFCRDELSILFGFASQGCVAHWNWRFKGLLWHGLSWVFGFWIPGWCHALEWACHGFCWHGLSAEFQGCIVWRVLLWQGLSVVWMPFCTPGLHRALEWKPIGEVGCWKSQMAAQRHWWIDRCFRSPLFLSLSCPFSDCLPTY